jgi:putative addiction module component (TIGR02574 family)
MPHLHVSIAERIELIGDTWDSLAETPDTVALTAAQEAEAGIGRVATEVQR